MEDEIPNGVWRIDAGTRSVLRFDRARTAFDAGDWAVAVVEAEELLDESPDHPEALRLVANASLELGQPEIAADAFSQLLESGTAGADVYSGLAVALFDLCEIPRAIVMAREAIKRRPDDAEAHYTLALALERTGTAESATHFAAARQLDPELYPFPLRLKKPDWERAYEQALALVAVDVATFWDGVPIRWEELPTIDELKAEHPPIRPTVGGLAAGEPPPEGDTGNQRPAALRLFQRNLARAPDKRALADDIAAVLESEAMAWLGLTEDDLDAAASDDEP